MGGQELIQAMLRGEAVPRPPYIPLTGTVAVRLSQSDPEDFATDPQIQARALVEAAGALHSDAVTVGFGTAPDVGAEVITRLRPMLAGRAVVGILNEIDVSGAKAYCEAGVDLLLVPGPEEAERSRMKTLRNACRFYRVPLVLTGCDDAALAEELQLEGAIVPQPRGDEPVLIGGGLNGVASSDDPPVPPRRERFFWSFFGQVPDDAPPEDLARLGQTLTVA